MAPAGRGDVACPGTGNGGGLSESPAFSWLLGRLIESQLYRVSPMDTVTVAGAAGVLTLVCLIASAIPARRAGSVNPLEALRAE